MFGSKQESGSVAKTEPKNLEPKKERDPAVLKRRRLRGLKWLGFLLLVGYSTVQADPKFDAARTTADSNPTCTAVAPFYWEIGNDTGSVVGGGSSGGNIYNADTPIEIASASKLIFAAYVVQKTGVPSGDAMKYMSMLSGYVDFSACFAEDSVSSCTKHLSNNVKTPLVENTFYYGGGHMQNYAALDSSLGISSDRTAALASDISLQTLFANGELTYSSPQLAGGAVTSTRSYAKFLRNILTKQLAIGNYLDTNAVCTNRFQCPATSSNGVGTGGATYAPFPSSSVNNMYNELATYGIGHWIEDTAYFKGDGVYSSPGLYGFYPWLDKKNNIYGVLARQVPLTTALLNATDPDKAPKTEYMKSVYCGRLIRRAYINGEAIADAYPIPMQ